MIRLLEERGKTYDLPFVGNLRPYAPSSGATQIGGAGAQGKSAGRPVGTGRGPVRGKPWPISDTSKKSFMGTGARGISGRRTGQGSISIPQKGIASERLEAIALWTAEEFEKVRLPEKANLNRFSDCPPDITGRFSQIRPLGAGFSPERLYYIPRRKGMIPRLGKAVKVSHLKGENLPGLDELAASRCSSPK